MFLGMNPDQAREFAGRIDAAQQRLASHATPLDGQVRASEGFWVGEDADVFRMSWSSGAGRLLELVCGDLAQRSATLTEEVEQQDTASAAETSGGAASDGTSGEGNPRGARFGPYDDDILPGDPENVSMEVAIAWHQMSEEDKQRVLEEIVEQELKRQGVDTEVTVHFDNIRNGSAGYWKEHDLFRGEHIVIDEDWAWNPYAMNIAAHEARHAAQDNWVEQTEPPGWRFWQEDTSEAELERIEREYGVTPEEIEAWRENDRDYHGGPDGPRPPDSAPQEERDAWEAEDEEYQNQPLEKDAVDTAGSFAEGMTLEEFQQYQRDAGVPVTS